MLKKIIPIPIGLSAVVVALLIFTVLGDNNTKNPGLLPPSDTVYEITQLEPIDAFTPNPIENREDLGPGEIEDQRSKRSVEPNKMFEKYVGVKDISGYENIQMLSNDDNSRLTILLSDNDITPETTNHEFIYDDLGVWISMYAITPGTVPLDDFTGDNLNDGFRVVKVNEQYDAALESMAKIEQFNEMVDRRLSLDMVTETHVITLHGFISDSKAIEISDYLSTR